MQRRRATVDDAHAGAMFTDGETLYDCEARRRIRREYPGGETEMVEQVLLANAYGDVGTGASWVPVEEVEGLDLVRSAPRTMPMVAAERFAA